MARVLVVAEEEASRDLIRRALEIDGHATTEARDAETALDLLRGEDAVDLLIADVRLPGMDGIALARAAAADFPALKIVLTTGFPDQLKRARALEPLIREALGKPFTLAYLRKMVGEILAGDGGEIRAGDGGNDDED